MLGISAISFAAAQGCNIFNYLKTKNLYAYNTKLDIEITKKYRNSNNKTSLITVSTFPLLAAVILSVGSILLISFGML